MDFPKGIPMEEPPTSDMRKADQKNRKIDVARRKEIAIEIKKSKAKYLITLGSKPLTNFIKYYNPDIRELNKQ